MIKNYVNNQRLTPIPSDPYSILSGLRKNVLPPRPMDKTAEEMEALYRRLLSGKESRAASSLNLPLAAAK